MSDKTINLLLTIAAIGLVCYGIYSMTTKKEKKKDDKTKNSQITFDYDKELDLVDNIILDKDYKFDNETKLKIAVSNLTEKDIKKTSSTFNDVNYYEFSGSYVKESTINKLLEDLFGKGKYTLKSFYNGDTWYLYNAKDKKFYIFYSTLVTNCMNSADIEVATNCIDIDEPYCEVEFEQDDNNIIANVECSTLSEGNISNYSYKFIYNYDKSLKDYYINDIKLIKE